MEQEEQQPKLLIPINKDAVEKYTRRLDNPWSLIGLFYRTMRRLRVARGQRLLKSLGPLRDPCSIVPQDETELEPLWVTIPEFDSYSMGWCMGGGEDVKIKFQGRYRDLPENSKDAFRRQYPEPKGWEGFYAMVELGDNKGFREKNDGMSQYCAHLSVLKSLAASSKPLE